MRRLPISCFIIAKNEADRIVRTINSLKGWVNEVVVVDSGSSDDTMAVARRAGARAISNPWPGFGEQKRFAEDQCTNDWLLNVDADEVAPRALLGNRSAVRERVTTSCCLRNAGQAGLPWSVEAKDMGTRPLVHPFVRSSRRSLSRFGSARLGGNRQPSLWETSGAAASLFNALV